MRIRDGKRLFTDGPFAETKEFLGGYYLVECETLDRALELAAACPGAARGSVEVRPVLDIALSADDELTSRNGSPAASSTTRAARLRRWPASSAISIWRKTRSPTPTSLRSNAGRADGFPANPSAWILTTARRRAIDRLRRERVGREKTARLAALAATEAHAAADEDGMSAVDDRLGLIFACCSSGLGRRVARRTHSERGGRTHHARNRRRVSRSGCDDGAAAGACEAQDPSGGDPLRRAARPPTRGTARRRVQRRLLDL